ncbi:dTDP-4-dehydrorhamnose reductase (plasmid) [Azospirillum thermophilum]|uniref:dTDP-4-dehydrorhamnose reductase n=2 Tax=Azospirillum thermophilum TaxID=2202148 RepID=A0A2S2CXP9_9PROT|nr:family 1 glycosylhydrolase [Azospirillum thermophilum]AWK89249.1 dTDP-4-dehydrorhamnose reductase [Azospirillum thermophilum]
MPVAATPVPTHPATPERPPLELWGGVECSVVRLRGGGVDQTRLSGHQDRPGDLDAFAELGIRAIRYPVLWERVAPRGLRDADWRWTDERLGRLRDLGVKPIATLLHHGNGPRGTDLTRPDFPAKFAAYAAAVARRYPWLELYTPINEPLTTARFCALYGFWHPHARDQGVFRRILVNQIQATRLAMAAIRAVNPAAKLVQTEDPGKVHGTPHMARQAEHENQRRWLTFDLLAGRVGRDHPLRSWLAEAGLERDLDELAADPCPPDILGIDHYLTSERFLDERVRRYPGVRPTAEGGERHVDLEAVRVLAEGVDGLETLMEEAWTRYRLPVAATEVHNGSSREEQLRWVKEAWDGARRLRERGVDVRAVTAWALLGSYDWNSLMTRRDGFYESGVFDVRGPRIRPTALAGLLRDLARTGDADHPVFDGPGWWRREDRFHWAPVRSSPYVITRNGWTPPDAAPRRLLIAGGGGTLAEAVARLCMVRGLPHVRLTRAELDLTDAGAVAEVLERMRPWAVVNAAGLARVDEAELCPARAQRDNVRAASILAGACAAAGLPLLGFSTHLVFDGEKRTPYREQDDARPLNGYGRSKREAELAVLDRCPAALMVRSGALFGPWDDRSPAARAIRTVAGGRFFSAACDVTVSPTYLPDLVNVALDLLIDGERGIWHLANGGAVTWAEFARAAVRGAGLNPDRVLGVPAADLGWVARRPAYSVLASARGAGLPSVEHALHRFLAARGPVPHDAAEVCVPEAVSAV